MMKTKIICLLFILFAGMSSALSQESGQVTLNITLHPIQILKINPGQSEVNISYENAADYLQGVVSLQQGHLTVFSTSGYEVSVYSDSPPFQAGEVGAQGQSPIGFQIAALLPETATGGISVSNINLQHYKQNIISSRQADLGMSFDIEYQGLGNNAYLEQINNALETTVLRTKLVYTIEVK